ncbi:MAG TPA: acyl-CoA dehydrogenase family protein [Trebonia sp.]
MTLSFELSGELRHYGRQLRDWSVREARPLAREADDHHALPLGWSKVLDSCPVPVGRTDVPDAEPIPAFSDGEKVTMLVYYENLNYGDTWVMSAIGGGIGHLPVKKIGTPAQIAQWYTPAVESGLTTGFALTEPQCGSDTSRIATTATRDGRSWVLNGSKIYCSLGAQAEYVTVFATTDTTAGAKGIAAFIVSKDTPGFVVVKANESKLGLRSTLTSELRFEDCVIPLENRLGWDATGPAADAPGLSGQAAALASLADNRPNVAAWAIGTAQASLDLTRERLLAHRDDFASRRWTLVETELERMNAALARGRRLNLKAQYLVDQGTPSRVAASISKAFSPQTCERVVLRCMQLLGPEGTSKQLLLEKWYRDIKILDIFEGTAQIQRLLVARHLMGRAVG